MTISLNAEAKIIEVWFSHASQQLYVDQNASAKWDRKVREGDTIELHLMDSPLGIYEVAVQRINKGDNSLSAEVAKKLGIPELGFAAALATDTRTASEAFAAAEVSSDTLNNVLAQPSRYEKEYGPARDAFRKDFSRLLAASGTSQAADVEAIATAVAAALGGASPPRDMLRKEIALMKDLWSAGPLGNTALGTFDADQEFDLVLTWKKAEGSSVKTPPDYRISIRFLSNWVISSTAGFAWSGLTDQNFTTKTVEVTPASGDKPAVTKKVAVREEPDSGSMDAQMLVNVLPTGDLAARWPGWLPRTIAVGVGIGTKASGRIYVGTSWMFSRTAALTIGAAGGNIKVLSQNVDVSNLGNVDPQAARRDRFRFAPFVGITWRIAGPAAK